MCRSWCRLLCAAFPAPEPRLILRRGIADADAGVGLEREALPVVLEPELRTCENVAVIERADLELGPGLNILTGETGAGKSILVDAMHAILGSRASRELVRTGAEKAVVCATFDPEPCRAWCDENEIECDDELIIRRQITAEGKTSCRVCGVPVTTAQLRDLGALLLDIHGQNDGRHLLDEREHLRSLDKFGRLEPELARYQAYQALCKERDTLSAYENEKELLTDSLSRQLEELEHAQLKAGEEAELTERSDLLRNFEKLSEAVDLAYDLLAGRDDSASALAGEALSEVERAANYAGELAALPEVVCRMQRKLCAIFVTGWIFPMRNLTASSRGCPCCGDWSENITLTRQG